MLPMLEIFHGMMTTIKAKNVIITMCFADKKGVGIENWVAVD